MRCRARDIHCIKMEIVFTTMAIKQPLIIIIVLEFLILMMIPFSVPIAKAEGDNPNYPNSGKTTLVSISSTGLYANNRSDDPSISADGRYIAFSSSASNLIENDTNLREDVFVHDRETGKTTLVSISSTGVYGNNRSESPSISADGRYVAFISFASNLVENDTNGGSNFNKSDVFVHDRQTGQTIRVSMSSTGEQANNSSFSPSISADGQFVAFDSDASNLVPNDTNESYEPYRGRDVFVHDRQTGQITRISVSSTGAQADNGSLNPRISADGMVVAFDSYATNLVANSGTTFPVYVHDRQTGQTTAVPLFTDKPSVYGVTPGNLDISADGRFVAFAVTLYSADQTIDLRDVFVHDRQTGQTTRIAFPSLSVIVDGYAEAPSISADGRFVAFGSTISNLVENDTNNASDIFVSDRQTNKITRVSVSSDGAESNKYSHNPSISDDGKFIAFESLAYNLDVDKNNWQDIFVHEVQGITPQDCPVLSRSTEQADSDGDGLFDCWEINGYDANGDGTLEVDLPAMGADPKHKDVFVHIDYMVAQDHIHEPLPPAIQKVVSAFDQAPVSNIDGKTGIHLHVDFGYDAPLTWGKTPTWGALSRAKPLIERKYIGTCTGDPTYPNFNDSKFKETKFLSFPSERMQIFHYGMWVHSLCELSNDAGVSLSAPGSDFIVSLGDKHRIDLQAAVFMHELGHNLGLCHGGPKMSSDPSTQCDRAAPYEIFRKPNYLSIMNYLFSHYGLIINGNYGNIDYSRFNAIPPLNENMLDETIGLNGGDQIGNYATIYYCKSKQYSANASQPIDWNCDGKAISTTITSDINNDSVLTTLDSYKDWENLIFQLPSDQTTNIFGSSDFTEVVGSAGNDIPAGDMPLDLWGKNLPPYVVSVKSPHMINLHPGDTTTFDITITNESIKDDTYTLSYTAKYDWLDRAAFPTSLEVAAGITKTLPITIHVPDNTIPGTRNPIIVSASSHGNPNMIEGARVIITIDPLANTRSFLPLVTR